MLSLPPSVRVFICARPTDLRCSFDRLAALASGVLRQDPLAGHLFLFRNGRGDRLKILYWDGDGYVIWYKRLEAGVFDIPADAAAQPELDARRLAALLGGFDPASARAAKRCRRPGLAALS